MILSVSIPSQIWGQTPSLTGAQELLEVKPNVKNLIKGLKQYKLPETRKRVLHCPEAKFECMSLFPCYDQNDTELQAKKLLLEL